MVRSICIVSSWGVIGVPMPDRSHATAPGSTVPLNGYIAPTSAPPFPSPQPDRTARVPLARRPGGPASSSDRPPRLAINPAHPTPAAATDRERQRKPARERASGRTRLRTSGTKAIAPQPFTPPAPHHVMNHTAATIDARPRS